MASVLAELDHGQCPDRFDVLLALYVEWASPDEAIALASSESTGWVLRSALAEGLGRFADIDRGTDARAVERIAACLARLVRDPDVGTRIAAVQRECARGGKGCFGRLDGLRGLTYAGARGSGAAARRPEGIRRQAVRHAVSKIAVCTG